MNRYKVDIIALQLQQERNEQSKRAFVRMCVELWNSVVITSIGVGIFFLFHSL